MPRPKVQISQVDFENTIFNLESQNQFHNLKALFDAMAGSPFGQALGDKFNYPIFYTRLREFGLMDKIKTRGKKGNDGSYLTAARAARGPRTSRKDKLAAHTPTFDALRARYPNKSSLIDKAQAGSLRAAIALKCYDCCGGQSAEIRACTANTCALYPLRPGGNSLGIVAMDVPSGG